MLTFWGSEPPTRLLLLIVIFCPFSFADDHSRVRLQTIEGDTNSDYINGNYIDVCILLFFYLICNSCTYLGAMYDILLRVYNA